MNWFLISIISIIPFYTKDAYNNNFKKVLLCFLFIFWVSVLGLQYETGTDYWSYYECFQGISGLEKRLYNSMEYFSYFLSTIVFKLNLHPQFGFIFFSIVQIFFFLKFITKYKFEHIELFLIIYFCCATAFINSTNALRQYAAMNIFLLSLIYNYQRNFIKYMLLILIASMFHHSALYLAPLYFINYILKIKSDVKFLAIAVALNVSAYIFYDKIISYIEISEYSTFLKTKYYLEDNGRDMISILSKLIYMPFFLHLFMIKGNLFEKKAEWFIRLGTLCYFFKLTSSFSFFLGRFSMYVDAIAYIPLYYYLCALKTFPRNRFFLKREVLYVIFMAVVILPYMYKTIVWGKNEYNYKSILVRYQNSINSSSNHYTYDFRNCYFYNAQN